MNWFIFKIIIIFKRYYIGFTVEPIKTATLWGKKKWPFYRGGRLIDSYYSQLLLNDLVVGVVAIIIMKIAKFDGVSLHYRNCDLSIFHPN